MAQKLTRRYSNQLDTPERRGTFAQRLKEALNRESTATGSSDNSSEGSYAVGINITGSHVGDQDIKYVIIGINRSFSIIFEFHFGLFVSIMSKFLVKPPPIFS